MQAWYVAKTKPRRERQTADVLTERGVQVFFPLYTPRRSRPAEHEPLFPGYIFVRLDVTTDQWLTVRSAPGVAYFLGSDRTDLPTPVPDELVAEIGQRVARFSRSDASTFRPGERVIIDGGPLDSLEAIFDGTLSAAGRCRVLIQIIDRLVPVQIEGGALRRAVA